MKHLDIEKAKNRYNKLMFELCLEYLTIDTNYSESTNDWNIRDMVAECDYQLGLYYEYGTTPYDELHHRYGTDDYKNALSITGKLKRFINTYSKFIDGVKCTQNHLSRKYDNYNS